MKRILQENLIKNIILVAVLLSVYFPLKNQILNSNISDGVIGNLLVVVSIVAVTACFGNFAFTYEKVDINNGVIRLIGHITTGLLMLVLGISLEMTAIFSGLLVGNFLMLNLCLFLLYLSAIFYDYWDIYRIN